MRQVSFIFFLFTCIVSLAQKPDERKAALSLDIMSIITERNVHMGFSHSFTDRWSAEGSMSIQISGFGKTTDEENEHAMMLKDGQDTEDVIIMRTRPEFRMGIRFWPGRYLEGCHIGIACSYSLTSGTDMNASVGYAARIWKGIGFSAGYGIRIFESLREGWVGAEGITIGIYYSF